MFRATAAAAGVHKSHAISSNRRWQRHGIIEEGRNMNIYGLPSAWHSFGLTFCGMWEILTCIIYRAIRSNDLILLEGFLHHVETFVTYDKVSGQKSDLVCRGQRLNACQVRRICSTVEDSKGKVFTMKKEKPASPRSRSSFKNIYIDTQISSKNHQYWHWTNFWSAYNSSLFPFRLPH